MSRRLLSVAKALAGSLLVALLGGCAGQSQSARGPVFFPPAPNLPRLQYLTGISNSTDVSGAADSFSLFAYGNAPSQKSVSIIKPSGIASGGGKIYVSDLSGTVFVIDLPNGKMETLRGDQGAGKLKKPVGVAVDHSGFVFVADVERKEVLIYDGNGDYLKSLGGDLDMHPTDVAVDDQNVYVLETRNAVIKVIDLLSGSLVREIGRLPEREKSLSLPTKMTLDGHGIIRVSNAGRGDITSYDRDGHFLGSFGKFGDGFGQFSRPKGVAADENGYVYVVDTGFQNVQVFDDSGRLLTYFGSGRLPVGGMNLPCDITITKQALPYYQKLAAKDFELTEVIAVANQFGHPRISLYGYGKLKGIDYDKVYREAAEKRERRAREELKRRSDAGQVSLPARQEQAVADERPAGGDRRDGAGRAAPGEQR